VSKLKFFSVMSLAVLAGIFAQPSSAAELKMADIIYCPIVPYERWYPFNPTVMHLDGKMNITPRTIFFSKHGQFRYTVHETAEGFTYLELFDVPVKPNFGAYIYLRYAMPDSPLWFLTYRTQSCMMQVHFCSTKEGVEEMIRMENNLLKEGDIEVVCGSATYVRHVNRAKLKGFIPEDPDD